METFEENACSTDRFEACAAPEILALSSNVLVLE